MGWRLSASAGGTRWRWWWSACEPRRICMPRRTATPYPTSDGKPFESDLHRDLMADLIRTLKDWFADHPQTYVSGNILLFYEPGNKRRHVSPDVLVVRGIPRHRRDNYLVWWEAKAPARGIELTSATKRTEDTRKKSDLYRSILKVPEYFLFDPRAEYLDPPFQGYRLRRGRYVAIKPIAGRLPSEVIGLHLEKDGNQLRIWTRLPVGGYQLRRRRARKPRPRRPGCGRSLKN